MKIFQNSIDLLTETRELSEVCTREIYFLSRNRNFNTG